jgi:hypothetical protein
MRFSVNHCVFGFALISVFAFPIVHSIAQTQCPPLASGQCKTTTNTSDCPCPPPNGYKLCPAYSEKVCDSKHGNFWWNHDWTCAENGNSSDICLDGDVHLCWEEYQCYWNPLGFCDDDLLLGMTDQSSRNTKKLEKCGS